MTNGGDRGRAFVVFGGFLGGTLAGGWLGLVATFVSGIASSDPPRFPDEDFVALVLASATLATLCFLVYQAGGRSACNDLLFVATFAAFVVLLSADTTGAIPLLSSLPALLVALRFVLAAVRRSVPSCASPDSSRNLLRARWGPALACRYFLAAST